MMLAELKLLRSIVEDAIDKTRKEYMVAREETKVSCYGYLQSPELTPEFKKRCNRMVMKMRAEAELLGRGKTLLEVMRMIDHRMIIYKSETANLIDSGKEFYGKRFEEVN